MKDGLGRFVEFCIRQDRTWIDRQTSSSVFISQSELASPRLRFRCVSAIKRGNEMSKQFDIVGSAKYCAALLMISCAAFMGCNKTEEIPLEDDLKLSYHLQKFSSHNKPTA